MTAQFKQSISWNGTGLFISSGSDVTERIRTATGIRWIRGKDQIRQYAPPRIGTESFKLDNQSRDYSPGNMDSVLFGKVKPGKKVRLSTEEVESEPFEFMDGEPFEFLDSEPMESFPIAPIFLFMGLTDEFRHNPAIGDLSVDVNCFDLLLWLSDKEISTAFYEGILISDALGIVLTAVGWPEGDRLIDISTGTLDSWCLNRENAFTAINTLVTTEGVFATFYCDGSGNFVFKNNAALSTETVSITSQAIFSDTQNVIVEGYDDRAHEVILAAQVTQVEREAQALDVVWSHEGELVLDANEEITLIVENSEPFKNAAEPSLVGVNAEQFLTPTAPLTNGSGVFNINGTDTAAINWNDSLATIQSVADAAIGAGNSLWTGSLTNGLRVQFTGDLAGKDIPLITVASSFNTGAAPAEVKIQDATDGGNQKYIIFPSAPLSAGTFKIRSVNGNTTTAITFNATDAAIGLKLIALPLIGPGDVTVSGGDIDTDTLTIEYQGALAGQFVPTSIVEQSSLRTATASTATLLATQTVKGGGPDVIITAGDATFSFPERDSGADVPLLVIAGPSGATLTNLHVRAQIMRVVRSRVVQYPESISLPDGQINKPTIRQEISLSAAQALVFNLYTRHSTSRPTENIVIYTDIRSMALYTVLRYGIGYLVTVIGAQNGINGGFHIQQLEHFIDWDHRLLISTFGCEQAG